MPELKLEFIARRDKPDFYLTKPVTTLGRSADSDVVFADTAEDRVVSQRHCAIERAEGGWRVRDLGASNKLLVNGEEVAEKLLAHDDVLQLGRQGPRVRVVVLDGRGAGRGSLVDGTRVVLREKLSRSYRLALAALAGLTVVLAVLYSLTHKSKVELALALHEERGQLERRISAAEDERAKLRLIARLNRVVLEREKLLAELPEDQRPRRSFVEEQVIRLMQRFHETSYAVPEIFVERVSHYLRYFTEHPSGRLDVERAWARGRAHLPRVKALLEEKKLPGELAYIAFVESRFDPEALNGKTGARGPWQLRAEVAKEHGLRVDEVTDERTDFVRSTMAARSLLLNLVSVFGVRSFMLVLAAYNAGDASLRRRLKALENPIEQRDFWTLVRLGVLREETSRYVPKFVAAVIVFEHLEKFGFFSPR